MGNGFAYRHLVARDTEFKMGDIVVMYSFEPSIYQEAGYEIHSFVEVYQQCPNLIVHMRDIPSHADGYLTRRIADKLAEMLAKGPECVSLVPKQMSKWLKSVKQYQGKPFERTGAIVMNCNPFTPGHRYLIEQACAQVDKRMIFVVEEDKSFFRFQDRIAMVRLGTADLDLFANVIANE